MEHQAQIMVNCPVDTAYNQWTQFESFPQFMEGVESVRQLNDTTTQWNVKVGGVDREFTADIVEQEPDRLIAWRSRTEPAQAGRVAFTPQEGGTLVNLWMDFEPEGFVEKAGDKLGFVQRRVEGDVKRFKEFIEHRGDETGAWRGQVQGGRSTQSPGQQGNGGSGSTQF